MNWRPLIFKFKMNCNKEEAVRAKEMAEKRMQQMDFAGAKTIAMKAQKLYSDLENISQMLTVCDVHCSAEHKVLGTDMNWYSILQVQQTADEASIKKQYRKLALLLHPDKNKFAGAEGAFKLIGEAQRVLSDQSKRSVFDMKYRTFIAASSRQPQPQRNRNSHVRNQPWQNNSTVSAGMNHYQQPSKPTQPVFSSDCQPPRPTQPGFGTERQTFWTACPFCSMRYQYYKDILNRSLRCQSCTRPFIAFDLNVQGVPPGTNFVHSAVPEQNEVPSRRNPSNTGVPGQSSFRPTAAQPPQKAEATSGVGRGSKAKVEVDRNLNGEDGKEGKQRSKSNTEKPNMSRKRGRKLDDESSDTDSSTGSDEYKNIYADSGLSGAAAGGRYPRRSTRQKQNVSYNEHLSDDDLANPTKKSKESRSSAVAEDQEEPLKEDPAETAKCGGSSVVSDEDQEVKERKGSDPLKESLPNGNGKAEECKTNRTEADAMEATKVDNKVEPDDSDGVESGPDFFEVPDPEFYDFDKDRKEDSFSVDQLWACYDDVDGMPRFYARIRKVHTPGFKLQFTWLEPNPDDQEGIDWQDAGLPIACGTFKTGKTENTENLGMFSHPIPWEKGNRRGSFRVYPRKGEIWALFRNWDIKWSSDPDNHKDFDFEFVEVQSDYTEGSAICVSHLAKVRGFVSLFRLKEKTASFHIPASELLRFSHQVPSYRTTGTERENVPEGYFELDPASLPKNMEEVADLEEVNVKSETTGRKINISCSKTPMKEANMNEMSVDNDMKNSKDQGSTGDEPPAVESKGHDNESQPTGSHTKEDMFCSAPSSPEHCDILSEFYNFDADRTQEKFQPGQIWALYCELDSLPKFLARISKVDLTPDFEIHVEWIEPCSLQESMIQWSEEEEIPICCGTFELGDSQVFTDVCTFSHRTNAKPAGKKNMFEIYPRKGEIWAVYKNFNSNWKRSDMVNCEYELMEILAANDSVIKVLPLERVDRYKTVFKAKRIGESPIASEISQVECFRFSHRIPAFQIASERDGIRRGFWELDHKAMPSSLLS